MQLTAAEYARYNRQLQMPNFGAAEQIKLREAKVLVVGAGGLGVPLLQYLAGAGIGTIGIVDFDRIDLSNLHRQVFYKESEVGQLKAVVAKTRVSEQNALVNCIAYTDYLDAEKALQIIADYDLVVDATDNFPTRYLVNDACFLLGKPLVYGAIYRFEGQVAVFNALVDGERSTNYRDLFPEPPAADLVPNCAEAGVLGVLPGIIGTMQATEAIKIITGIGEPLVNRLFTLDVLNYDNYTLKIKKNDKNPLQEMTAGTTALNSIDQLCTLHPKSTTPQLQEINYQELLKWQHEERPIQVVDVRTLKEHLIHNIGGACIPLPELIMRQKEISRDKAVVLYCHSGIRSVTAIEQLQEVGFTDLYNLKGGILRAR